MLVYKGLSAFSLSCGSVYCWATAKFCFMRDVFLRNGNLQNFNFSLNFMYLIYQRIA
jgi:hypothetical protein